MDYKKLLDLKLHKLDYSNEKLINETRGELLKAMHYINDDIEESERSGKSQEAMKLQLDFERMKNKIFELDQKVNEKSKNRRNGHSGHMFGDELKGRSGGGKALNESGTIRLYRPDQRLTDDSETSEINLGSFLRSVVDKPRTSAEREMIQNSVDSSGYSMPETVAMELIDKLRAVNPVISAGARTISIDGLDKTKFVKINGDPDAVWHTELDEEALGDPTFGAVEMSPKTVLSLTEVSREVMQDSMNIEEALTNAFTGSINQAILEATFSGTGGKQPTGMATTVTQTQEYATGGTPDWADYVKASRTLHDENIPTDTRSFIHAPDIWEAMALITDDNGRYQDAPSFIRDVPNFTSSGVPAGIGYAGDFSNVVYGFRLNITLEQHNSLSVRKYGTIWLAAARLDIATFRPSAFVRVEEASA